MTTGHPLEDSCYHREMEFLRRELQAVRLEIRAASLLRGHYVVPPERLKEAADLRARADELTWKKPEVEL